MPIVLAGEAVPMLKLHSDLPERFVQERTVNSVHLVLENASDSIVVLHSLVSLDPALKFRMEFVGLERPVRNVLAPGERRELEVPAELRLSPGKHRLGIEARLAVPSAAYLNKHLHGIEGLRSMVGPRLGQRLDPARFSGQVAATLVDPGSDQGRRESREELGIACEVLPNPELEALRGKLEFSDFRAGLPGFGLALATPRGTIVFENGRQENLGDVSLDALEELGRRLKGRDRFAIYLGNGTSGLRESFPGKAHEPGGGLAQAADALSGRLPYLLLSRSELPKLWEELRRAGLSLRAASFGELLAEKAGKSR
jgi:hypothetical protein